MKEQQKHDGMVSDLAERVGRILSFIKPIQEKNMDEDIELLGGVIKKLYDLILDAAVFTCDYVRRNALSASLVV